MGTPKTIEQKQQIEIRKLRNRISTARRLILSLLVENHTHAQKNGCMKMIAEYLYDGEDDGEDDDEIPF